MDMKLLGSQSEKGCTWRHGDHVDGRIMAKKVFWEYDYVIIKINALRIWLLAKRRKNRASRAVLCKTKTCSYDIWGYDDNLNIHVNCKLFIPCISFSGVQSSLVLGYSLWDNRKIITCTANVHFEMTFSFSFPSTSLLQLSIDRRWEFMSMFLGELLQMVSHWSLAIVGFVINKRLKLNLNYWLF